MSDDLPLSGTALPDSPAFKWQPKTLGDLRDWVFIVTVTLYLLGYATWSAYSWEYRLGFLPVVQAQYLIAGIVPMILVLSVYMFFRLISRFFAQHPSTRRQKLSKFVGTIGFISIAAAGLVALWEFITTHTLKSEYDDLIGNLSLVGVVFFCLSIVLIGAKSSISDRVFAIVMIGLPTLTIAVALWSVYVFVIFPGIAQEVGGARRCVYAELEVQKLTRITFEHLSNYPEATKVSAGSISVLAINHLFVLFDSPQYVVVTRGSPKNSSLADPEYWVRLPSSSVLAMRKCTTTTAEEQSKTSPESE
jgi:hypothetical protein